MAITTAAASDRSRGASCVRPPMRSATYSSGWGNGPCDENTSRYGRAPSRIATAVAPYTPSSKLKWRDDSTAGRRSTTAASDNHSTSVRVGRWVWPVDSTVFAPYATAPLSQCFVHEFGHDDCYLRPTW